MIPDKYCREKIAPGGSGFHYSVLFLPPAQRRALTALFACFQEIREILYECADPTLAKIKLQWWRQELAATFCATPHHPVTHALLPAIRQFDLPQHELQKIIDGVENGVTQNRIADFAALQNYCLAPYGSAEQLAARILGFDGVSSAKYAPELGLAFGLTDIILTVRDDARRNRILLPQDELARYGVAAADILNLRETENFKKLIEFVIARAENCYNRATSDFPRVPKARRARLALAAINLARLQEIRKDGCRILRRRVDLTPLRKLWLAWLV